MSRNANLAGQRSAFTLIELLVVVSIIALLVSIMLPALGKAREQARRTVCSVGQRSITTAAHMYAEDNNHVLPMVIAVNREAANYTWLPSTGVPADLYTGLGGRNGLGLLIRAGVFGDYTVLYCPSGYQVFPPQLTNPTWTAYYWRFYSSNGAANTWPKADRQHPRRAVTADVFALHDSRYVWGERFLNNPLWHGGGMMVGRMDTTVVWTPDHGNLIRDGMLPDGPYYGRPHQLMSFIWGRLDLDQGW